MRNCSIVKRIKVERGGLGDYEKLARYHYRDGGLGAFCAIFVMRYFGQTVGVIVYTMPSINVELRNVATGGFFAGFDRRGKLSLINKNVRRISRVIIEPRFRGVGLASRLVRETMPRMGVRIVEALTVMGLVNPFFEKAGMEAYSGPTPVKCAQLVEAFGMVGIEESELNDAERVQERIEKLPDVEGRFIEGQVRFFLDSYGKRRLMEPGVERMEYVLSKLMGRPMYYIWFNGKLGFRV